MKELWKPIVGGRTINKDWTIRFLIDYNNTKLKDFYKKDYSYAKGIRFDYYNVKADELENLTDMYYTDFAIVYNQFLSDIPTNDSCYCCFIDTASNASDINGLLYRIATTNYADIVKYNTLIAIKSKNIRTIVA